MFGRILDVSLEVEAQTTITMFTSLMNKIHRQQFLSFSPSLSACFLMFSSYFCDLIWLEFSPSDYQWLSLENRQNPDPSIRVETGLTGVAGTSGKGQLTLDWQRCSIHKTNALNHQGFGSKCSISMQFPSPYLLCPYYYSHHLPSSLSLQFCCMHHECPHLTDHSLKR